jgi:hypothetical protein
MRKLLMLATTAFVVSAVAPAFAEDAAPAAPAAEVTTTTEATKDAPKAGKHRKGKGMFERGDTNGDGVVTKEEFLKQSEEAFKNLDTDGDGKITKAEVDAKRKKMKELHAKRKKQMGGKPVPGNEAPAADKPVEEKSE